MLVFLSSDDTSIISDNQPHDFTTLLKETLNFEDKRYECAIIDFSHNLKKKTLHVYSDLCDYSLVGPGSKPLLRIIKNPDLPFTPYYVPIGKSNTSSIRIYITDLDHTQIKRLTNVRFVIHIRERK
jgi:hypothetical protein